MLSRHLASDQLAEHLSESLRSQTDFVLCCGDVLAGQDALWEALEACSIGDDSGIALLLALDNYRQQALIEKRSAIVAAHDPAFTGQIQISCPWLIAELFASSVEDFKLAMANCWRVIVFLTPSDLQDPILDYCLDVIDTAFSDRRFGLCFFWDRHAADAEKLSKRLRLRTSEHWQLSDVDHVQRQALLYASVGLDRLNESLDGAFWQRVRLNPSLVSSRHYDLCVNYAECGAHKQIPSAGITSTGSKLRTPAQQYIVFDPAFAPQHAPNWKQNIVLGLPEEDLFGAMTDHSFGGREQAQRLCIACSNHGILSFLTSPMTPDCTVHPEDRDVLALACFLLFSRLSNGESAERLCDCLNNLGINETLSKSILGASLESWASLIESPSEGYLRLSKQGLSRLHGVTRVSELAPQLSLSPPVPASSPNGQGIGYLPKGIFRHLRRGAFVWNGRLYAHLFDDLKSMRVYLRPATSDERSFWLDAEADILSLERCQRIADILSQKALPRGIECHASAHVSLQKLIQKLLPVSGHFPNVIAVSPGAALWWTFAGAELNAQTAAILGLLSPSLSIAYGNFSLRLSWHSDSAHLHGSVATRLKAIWAAMLALAVQNGPCPQNQSTDEDGHLLFPCLSAFKYPSLDVLAGKQIHLNKGLHHQATGRVDVDRDAIREAWRCLDPHDFLNPILPMFIQDARFLATLEKWSAFILGHANLSIVAVEELVGVDPIIFAPPLALKPNILESPSAGSIPSAVVGGKKSEQSVPVPVQPLLLARRVMPSSFPPEDGQMRTRLPWTLIETQRDFNLCLSIILKHDVIGLDVETTLYDHRLCLIQIGLAKESFIIDALKVNFDGLRQVFEHPNIIKVIHHAPFERSILSKHQMTLNNVIDTCSVSRKRYGKVEGGHSLRAVCLREFQFDMDKTPQTSRWEARPLSSKQLEYAALDAEILIHLYRKFFKV